MKNLGFEYNKIIVIESLPDKEMQLRDGVLMSSGEYFIKSLFPYCNTIRGDSIRFELHKVDSEEELLERLSLIEQEIRINGDLPLIHFEVHVSKNSDGVTLKNEEFVSWEVVLDKLTKINIATANNLFVIFATCSGANNLKYIMPRDEPFPYYAAIAPDNIDFPILLEQRISLFYLDLLIGGNIEDAFRKVTKKDLYANLILSTCEFYLYKSFINEISKLVDSNRMNRLIEILERNSVNVMNKDELSKAISEKFSDPTIGERVLIKMKNKLLMANDPRNSKRFEFSITDLKQIFSEI